MDKFVVSARKYRPQNFNTVVGQAHISTTLKNAINHNQLAHAFLFCGPRGVGKTTCARILAKTINCENRTKDGEACNQCNSCLSFNDGASLNIHELDAASNNSVDDIRSLVEQVRFAPQAGKYKVYIIDEVHMLSTSAFNAFLKTLEEPPSYAIFILATTEKHKILPTILSRCQIFDFKRITTNDTVEHLQEIADKEEIKAEKGALQVIAQKSEGCMRDALSILDKIVSFTNGAVTYQNTLEHLNILDADYFFKMLQALQEQDMASAMLLYDEINRKGFEGDLVLNGFAEFIRNLLVCKDAKAMSLLDVVEGMQDKYGAVAKATSAAYLLSSLNIICEAELNYKMARNKKLHVELALIKLNFLQQAIDLSMQEGAIVKKKRIDGAVAIRNKPVPSIQLVQQVPTMPSAPQKEAKLYIEAKPAEIKREERPAVTAVSPELPAMLKERPAPAIGGTKKNLLQSLRDRYGDKYTIEEVKEAESLEMTKLQECWRHYTQLIEQQQKHSAAATFRIARLEIEHDLKFTATVTALTAQKFIEQEKMNLIDYVQQQFHNRGITMSILVEVGEREELPLHMILNSRQRFERIAEQYPLLKDLKEKLKLEIDY